MTTIRKKNLFLVVPEKFVWVPAMTTIRKNYYIDISTLLTNLSQEVSWSDTSLRVVTDCKEKVDMMIFFWRPHFFSGDHTPWNEKQAAAQRAGAQYSKFFTANSVLRSFVGHRISDCQNVNFHFADIKM
jgi:hypothetical protein